MQYVNDRCILIEASLKNTFKQANKALVCNRCVKHLFKIPLKEKKMKGSQLLRTTK